jgi:hypothetical protein
MSARFKVAPACDESALIAALATQPLGVNMRGYCTSFQLCRLLSPPLRALGAR